MAARFLILQKSPKEILQMVRTAYGAQLRDFENTAAFVGSRIGKKMNPEKPQIAVVDGRPKMQSVRPQQQRLSRLDLEFFVFLLHGKLSIGHEDKFEGVDFSAWMNA